MLPHLLIFTLTFAPSFIAGALYPKDSHVKTIDTRGFRNALKENRTSVVAFVASWCGYCKAMAPEYSKAALGLHPLIPLYAVDCDENRSLCAEQGVKGFPTVKLFPRGKEQAPVLFEHPDRTASAFFYFATRRVPHKNQKLDYAEIESWVNDKIDQTRVLLLSKAKDIPLMWKVLANKYRDALAFANHYDRDGKSSVMLGYDSETQKETKILIYLTSSAKPLLFEGFLKYESISNFLNSILDGTANLTPSNSHPPKEGHTSVPAEEKIAWEEDRREEDTYEREENVIHRAIRLQLEREAQDTKEASGDSILEMGDTDQVILESSMTNEPPTPSTVINSKAVPQSPETCIAERATDKVAPSCASPIAEEVLSILEGVAVSEEGHVKDEL